MRATRPEIHSATAARLPYVIIGVVTIVDVFAGAAVLLALLAAPPALAAATAPPRKVVKVGVVAFTACLVPAVANDLLFTRRGLVAFCAIAAVTAAAAYTSAVRLRLEDALVDARAVAEVAQEFILGPVPERTGPVELAVSCTSAAPGARIGGDLYEAVPVPGGVRIIVGDVQGKGLGAVTTAVTVLEAFREAAPYAGGLGPVAEHVERALGRRAGRDEFVTAVLADCGHDGTLTILNLGHPAPLIRHADGTTCFAEPDRAGLPLGLGLSAPGGDGPRTTPEQLNAGDRILFYTDGTVEARDGDGAFFPLAEHAELLDHPDLPRALADLRNAVAEHAGGTLDDDAAMLLVRLDPAASG